VTADVRAITVTCALASLQLLAFSGRNHGVDLFLCRLTNLMNLLAFLLLGQIAFRCTPPEPASGYSLGCSGAAP
jgi:hypothetical protein